MQGEEPPPIVDLERYRKALRAEAARASKPAPRERILGSRRSAGVILVLIISALIGWWLLTHIR